MDWGGGLQRAWGKVICNAGGVKGGRTDFTKGFAVKAVHSRADVACDVLE